MDVSQQLGVRRHDQRLDGVTGRRALDPLRKVSNYTALQFDKKGNGLDAKVWNVFLSYFTPNMSFSKSEDLNILFIIHILSYTQKKNWI